MATKKPTKKSGKPMPLLKTSTEKRLGCLEGAVAELGESLRTTDASAVGLEGELNALAKRVFALEGKTLGVPERIDIPLRARRYRDLLELLRHGTHPDRGSIAHSITRARDTLGLSYDVMRSLGFEEDAPPGTILKLVIPKLIQLTEKALKDFHADLAEGERTASAVGTAHGQGQEDGLQHALRILGLAPTQTQEEAEAALVRMREALFRRQGEVSGVLARLGKLGHDLRAALDAVEAKLKPKPSLDEPCPHPERGGHHELYANAGPGGKGDRKPGWQCCQACGANGPLPGWKGAQP